MNEKFAKAYQVERDEKLTQVFIYTPNMFARGEAITKEAMRVSTWLRTAAMPDYVHLMNAQILIFGGGAPASSSFQEMLIPSHQISAIHLQPTLKDPLDYDETEQNRKMEPVTALFGTFRFYGHMRMALQLDVGKNMEVNRGTFMSFYDVEISNASIPTMGVIRIPFALIRPEHAYFGLKTS